MDSASLQDRPASEQTRLELSRLLAPRAVVLYGASDRSAWSAGIVRSTRAHGFEGQMYVVNRRGEQAHGLRGFTSATMLPERVDAAYVMVPADAVVDAFEDLSAAGI